MLQYKSWVPDVVTLAPISEVPDTYKSLISVIAPSRLRAPVIVRSSVVALVPVTVLTN
jgi:hypothetical protein